MSKAQEVLQKIYEVSPVKKFRYRPSKKQIGWRLSCPPGYRLKGSTCKRISPVELRILQRRGRRVYKRFIKPKSGAFIRKRQKSLARRRNFNF